MSGTKVMAPKNILPQNQKMHWVSHWRHFVFR